MASEKLEEILDKDDLALLDSLEEGLDLDLSNIELHDGLDADDFEEIA